MPPESRGCGVPQTPATRSLRNREVNPGLFLERQGLMSPAHLKIAFSSFARRTEARAICSFKRGSALWR
jgi:hypothetical protein